MFFLPAMSARLPTCAPPLRSPKSRYGRLDIAVNAAGIANANPALEMESEQWQRVIDINLTGIWNSCKAEAELMLESGGGSIINIASMSGIIVNRGLDQAHC